MDEALAFFISGKKENLSKTLNSIYCGERLKSQLDIQIIIRAYDQGWQAQGSHYRVQRNHENTFAWGWNCYELRITPLKLYPSSKAYCL